MTIRPVYLKDNFQFARRIRVLWVINAYCQNHATIAPQANRFYITTISSVFRFRLCEPRTCKLFGTYNYTL